MLLHQVLIGLQSYVPKVFGDVNEKDFNLLVNMKRKTKRSVETNQAASNLDN